MFIFYVLQQSWTIISFIQNLNLENNLSMDTTMPVN